MIVVAGQSTRAAPRLRHGLLSTSQPAPLSATLNTPHPVVPRLFFSFTRGVGRARQPPREVIGDRVQFRRWPWDRGWGRSLTPLTKYTSWPHWSTLVPTESPQKRVIRTGRVQKSEATLAGITCDFYCSCARSGPRARVDSSHWVLQQNFSRTLCSLNSDTAGASDMWKNFLWLKSKEPLLCWTCGGKQFKTRQLRNIVKPILENSILLIWDFCNK